MSGAKDYPASDYTDFFGLAMAHEGDPLEVTQDGINFELLADYPNPDVSNFDSGCLVILDDKNLFLAGGGRYGSSKAYIYNKDANVWRTVGNMAEPRTQHSCGLVQSNSGYEVVVFGGNQGQASSIEIFSVETETWRPGMLPIIISVLTMNDCFNKMTFSGNEVSFRLSYADDIRVDDTFAMVGGIQGSADTSDTIVKYLPESGTFLELPGKMKLPRYDTTAILVDRSIFPPCV